ncbi:MAG: MgtC/SapB family protein [Bacteroidia bacterium]|nr:MgtC/SapB family protein [Bacteroidia bacterium]MDW8157391.1 MgtC/SapB family protein [Bacteroidia bacterium]
MTLWEFSIRILLAFVLGGAIGLERQWRQKSAGLRTNTLVSLGAAAFTLISYSITSTGDGIYRGDATRVVGQIITGIGFLGAGVIMKDGLSVQGLNTAATIWCSASVGAIAGVGLFAEAFLVTIMVMLTHLLLRPIGLKINRIPASKDETTIHYYHLKIRCKAQVENHIRILILDNIRKNKNMYLRSLKSTDNGTPAYAYIEATVGANGKHDVEMEQLAGILTIEFGVTEVSWETQEQALFSDNS